MSEKLITPQILAEIADNPAFELIFSECVADQTFMETFNRLTNSSINFQAKAKDAISLLIDQATGFDGVLVKPEEMEKLIYLIFRSVYLPSQDHFLSSLGK
ncbi:hypothetical protein ACQWTT_001170 [Acinetobacter baumannii]